MIHIAGYVQPGWGVQPAVGICGRPMEEEQCVFVSARWGEKGEKVSRKVASSIPIPPCSSRKNCCQCYVMSSPYYLEQDTEPIK